MLDSLIYIIDDNKEFRDSTSWMLEGVGYSVQQFSTPTMALEALTQNTSYRNSCCLLDIRMPDMTGLELHETLISKNVDIPIIYMTGHGDIPLAVEAMAKGAITFLEKPLNVDLLTTAITTAFNKYDLKNNTNVDQEEPIQDPEYKSRIEKLTAREREVLNEIVSGKMNKAVAIDLGISVKTVELHRSRVMSKMHAKTTAELVKMYITRTVSL